MTTTTVQLVPARAEQADELGHLIAVAFAELKISSWLVDEPMERLHTMDGQFAMVVRHAVDHGQVTTTADASAVAVWLPVLLHHPIPQIPDYDRRLAAICGPYLDRFISLDQAMHAHHPHEPHWYLAFLAVHPCRQGHGIGSALLAAGHQLLDRDGLPAFLHAGDRHSRRLYLRHGYTDHGAPFPVGPDAPLMWPMWRDPAAHPIGVGHDLASTATPPCRQTTDHPPVDTRQRLADRRGKRPDGQRL
jgi:GNAT superfamily N-acetyltransferase